MRIKYLNEMRTTKRDALMQNKWYQYIYEFSKIDTKGYY
jgi:hypothetical protein